jgi:microcystin degradation protein MlrC
VHFRAAYQATARAVLVAAAPGPVTADLRRLRFARLRPGVRIAGG